MGRLELDAMTDEEADELLNATEGMRLHTPEGAIVNSVVLPVWNEDAYEYPQVVCNSPNHVDHRAEPRNYYGIIGFEED